MLLICKSRTLASSFLLLFFATICSGQIPSDGLFSWKASPPLLEIDETKLPESNDHPWIAVKDPSIVRFDGQWHLFCTLRKNKTGDGRIRIGYLSFRDWAHAREAQWTVLELTMGYHGAPQIFWFEPHRKWYLIYQAEDQTRNLKYGPCFSTNDDISKPGQWTRPEPLYHVPDGTNAGLDFWVICDADKAHLFFTTLDGRMWRAETKLDAFPDRRWSKPLLALKADIFEASHIYRLANDNRFITIVEAQRNRRRYFKAFVSDALDGDWSPIAATPEKPLVSPVNVVNQHESWATSYSHGEFIRAGYDQTMTINAKNLRLLFQGASDDEYRERPYGQIPWRLGILTMQPAPQ